jgi:hypothetical protein
MDMTGSALITGLGPEHSINSTMIKLVKELHETDQKAEEYRKKGSYEAYLATVNKQIALELQIAHFITVRIARSIGCYRSVEGMIRTWEKKCDDHEKQLMDELRKLQALKKNDSRNHMIGTVKAQLDSYGSHLRAHRMRIDKVKRMVSSMRSDTSDNADRLTIKVRKVKHLA